MNKITIRIGSKRIAAQLPATWAEVAPYWEQIAGYVSAGLYHDPLVIRILLRQKRWGRMRPLRAKDWRYIRAEGLKPLQDCLDFLAKPTGQPIKPYVTLGRKKYYLPAENMSNASIVEFAFADLAFQLITMYQERNDETAAQEWMARFCAYLCRPIDKRINPKDALAYQGDRREVFNTAMIEPRIADFHQLAPHHVLACLQYFAGVKHYLAQRYDGSLFIDLSHEEDPDQIIGLDTTPRPKRYLDAISRLAGGKFGDLNATRRANLYDVLEEIKNQLIGS